MPIGFDPGEAQLIGRTGITRIGCSASGAGQRSDIPNTLNF